MFYGAAMRLFILFLLSFTLVLQPVHAVNYKVSGDIRTGYFSADRDDRNGTQNKTDEGRLRLRVGVSADLTDSLQAKVRFAGRYSTDDRNENYFKLFESIPSTDGLRRGDSTLDEIYLKSKLGKGASLMVGRMQTKLELEGVAKKSLDRNDSPNTDINWTDGIYLQYPLTGGWKMHAIAQYNPASGPTELRRSPLNFSDSDSRISYFAAFEKKSKTGLWAQRGIDVTYLPSALQKDGTATGRIEDYWAVVGRAAARWPVGQGGSAWMLGAELGIASEAPTNAAVGLPGGGDAGNTAFQLTFNWLNFIPAHSIGLVVGRAEAGWLLSPDFRDNTDLLELRYKWALAKKHKLEARVRRREDSELKTGALKEREDVDLYVRYTYKF
jgi:hypothetical protein